MSQARYDFVISFRHQVVQDVFVRSINASLLTNLALTTPISRVIAQTIPPFQVMAHWDKPELELADDLLRLSADVRGGARYAIKGINLTMEGGVNAECRPTIVASEDGQPVVALIAPSAWDLDLADLELSYEGDDKPLSWLDATMEKVILRPTLSKLLFASLASMPLSYLPDSLPLRLKQKPNGASGEGLILSGSAAILDSKAESLMVALRIDNSTPPPPWPANLLPESTKANAAVALSETGLNKMLGWLCAEGLATGTTQLAAGPVSWRWTHATVTFTDEGNIHLFGHLLYGAKTVVVDTALRCSLTSSGQLYVRITAGQPRKAAAELIVEAAATLIRRVFYAATSAPNPAGSAHTSAHSTEKLLQCFMIPGLGISAKATAVDLVLRDGYLAASYDIPLAKQYIGITIEETKPDPTITQPVVPHQKTPGAPVTTQIQATLASTTEPPYDYAWQVDHEPRSGSHRNATITVTKTPSPTTVLATTVTQPQKLATVSLKVIDMLGQVGETELDATYYPAPPSQEQENKEIRKEPIQTRTGGSGGGGVGLLIAAFILFLLYYYYQHPAGSNSAAPTIPFPVTTAPTLQSMLNVYISDPSATVSDSTSGRTCTQLCHWSVSAGTQVTLTATASGSIPTNWVGCDNSTTGPNDPCTISLNDNRSVCLVPYDPYQPNLVSSDRCRELAGG